MVSGPANPIISICLILRGSTRAFTSILVKIAFYGSIRCFFVGLDSIFCAAESAIKHLA